MPTTRWATEAGTSWPTTRILFALAGTMTVLSAALAATLSSWFLLLAVLVGANQWLYVARAWCPASLIIDRLRRGPLPDTTSDTLPGTRPTVPR